MVQFTSYTKKKIQIVCGSVQQIWLPADFYDRSFVVWYQPSTAQPPWTWLLVDRMVEVRSFNLTDDMDSWSLSTNPFVGHSSWLALILLFSGSLGSEVKKIWLTFLGDWSSPFSGGATTSTLIRSGNLRRSSLNFRNICLQCLFQYFEDNFSSQTFPLLCQHLPSKAEHCPKYNPPHVKGQWFCTCLGLFTL